MSLAVRTTSFGSDIVTESIAGKPLLESTILAKDIVALVQSDESTADGYALFYCAKSLHSGDTIVSPAVLKSISLVNPPGQLINDFTPASNSLLQAHRGGDKPDLHVVLSTGSGTGLATSVWQSLVKPLLDQQKLACTLHETTSSDSIKELVESTILPKANKGIRQTVILLSGDGGVVDTINALLSHPHSPRYTKPCMCILPLGTGNALSHSSGNANDNTLGLSALSRGRPGPLPLFTATFSPRSRLLVNESRDEQPLSSTTPAGNPLVHGAVVCSWGLHASLVADSDTAAYRRHGAERFQLAAKEALYPADGSPPHEYRGKVSVLKKRHISSEEATWQPLERRKHGYVLATSCSQLEKGFTISPLSGPLDGKLRLVHFGPMSGDAAMEVMGKAYAGGGHVEDERVGYEEIEGLRVEFEEEEARWRRVCVDGKIVRVERGGFVEVRSGVEAVVDLVARVER